MEKLSELVEERKKLCSGSFFSRVMGYNVGWVNRAERGLVKVSERFVEDYERALNKVKELYKK